MAVVTDIPEPASRIATEGQVWRQWMRDFGGHVRRVREFLGLSQQQLAHEARVSQGAVSHFESGRGLSTPFLGILKINIALARALKTVDQALISDDVRRFLRQMEFLAAGRWLAIDSGFHHFGNRLKERFPVPHPEGTERTWNFSLEHVPQLASLVLHVVDMAPPRGGGLVQNAEDDELRTYVSINGRDVDPMGLNHRLPLNAKDPVRLSLPIDPAVLRAGENILRLRQTPQKEEPHTFDDCGVFGIGLELREE